MGNIVKGLFGGGQPTPAPVVIPPRPEATPMPDPEAQRREAQRKLAREAALRNGRITTALASGAGEDGKLGG